MDCFDNIIGFTRSTCPCFQTSDLGTDYNKSNSGLFMDELQETEFVLKAIKSIQDCGKSMGDIFATARRNAVQSLREQVFQAIGTRFQVRQVPFNGLIGQLAFTGPLLNTGAVVGSIYETRPYKGGIMRVNRINVAFDQTGTVDVKIYKAYAMNNKYVIQGDVIKTVTCNTIANQAIYTTLDEPLDLPVYDSNTYLVNYLFLIERGSFNPMDNKASCGCQLQYLVDKWLIQGGVQGTDLNNIQVSSRRTGSQAPVYGVVIDAEVKCSDTSFVCENYINSPFMKVAMEKAVQFEAGSNLLQAILRSDDVNRYQMTRREQVATDAAILHNKFKSRIDWISENIDLSTNTCYVCNTINETHLYKTNIRL